MARQVRIEVVGLSEVDGELHWQASSTGLEDGATADSTARKAAGLAHGAEPGVVLHSTSWREDGAVIVLTYAVFPAPRDQAARPLRRHLVTGPGPLQPTPGQVLQEHVAAHAVRHLADLAADRDPHVLACVRDRPEAWALLRRHAALVHVDHPETAPAELSVARRRG